MPKIVVVGGGLIGMATAMMLAQDGAEVIVLERDDDAVPGSPGTAWQDWDRPGIAQFRQPHLLLPAGHYILGGQLPDVAEAVQGAGAIHVTRRGRVTSGSPRPPPGARCLSTRSPPARRVTWMSAAA